MLHSGETIRSPDAFNTRVRERTRFVHERKLRGLYVDYADGALQLPAHITEQGGPEAHPPCTGRTRPRREEWTEQVEKAHWLSQFSPTGRTIWIAWIYWAIYAHPEIAIPALRDGTFAGALIDLAPQFEHVLRSAKGILLPSNTGQADLR